MSADAVSEGSFVDLEELENNYELDFMEHYVTQIERLDMQASQSRGKQKKWEIIKLHSGIKIEG